MRRILAIAFPIFVAFVLVSRGAEWLSEKWWFAALDQSAAWWTYTKWRGGAFAVAAPLWLAIVGLNLRLAWHQSLVLREPLSLLGGGMERISVGLSPSLRLGRTLLQMSVWGTAWLAGIAAANRFDLWVLFSNGARDTTELGFFLLRLPALQWFFSWLGAALGLTLVACGAVYFWLEAIETGPGTFRVSATARHHLSFLGALFLAWKGADCALRVLSAPIVFGDSTWGILGVPEQMFGVPANQFFAWSALPVAALVFWLGARENGKRAFALGAFWLAGALVLPPIAPSFARSIGIGNETAEHEIIAQHLAATRAAWGFEGAKDETIAGNATFVDTALPASGARAPVALWPLGGAATTLNQRLSATPLNAARLHIARGADGLILRAIATRRALVGEAPAREWEAPIDEAGALGWKTPRALDSILLSEAAPTPQSPNGRLGATSASASATEQLEPLPRYRLTAQSRFVVDRASLGACFVLAARFFDWSLLRPGPPVMLHLDPVERARTLAPFVNWSGAIAHPVVLESGVGPHVYWIVEGCFTARTHPNAATLPAGEDWGGINYARQNVTAVFDGTTGESQLYLFDRDEPLARVWNRALPELFRPIETMPAGVRAAIKPSPAWLNATTRIYARYHPVAGDEAQQWETRKSAWRPILASENSPTPQWNDALLPDNKGNLTSYQLSAFAPARGQVATGDGVAALTGIAGVTLGADNRWRWRQWRPVQQLPLPAFSTPPQATYNNETGVRFAPPTRVGVFPTFNAQNKADGFTAFRASVQPEKNQTPAILTVEAKTTGAINATATASASNSLAPARDLWRAILAARRKADWTRVAQLEAQLSRALGATTSSDLAQTPAR